MRRLQERAVLVDWVGGAIDVRDKVAAWAVPIPVLHTSACRACGRPVCGSGRGHASRCGARSRSHA
eukprot:5189366-Prymnesium_polylepis.1